MNKLKLNERICGYAHRAAYFLIQNLSKHHLETLPWFPFCFGPKRHTMFSWKKRTQDGTDDWRGLSRRCTRAERCTPQKFLTFEGLGENSNIRINWQLHCVSSHYQQLHANFHEDLLKTSLDFFVNLTIVKEPHIQDKLHWIHFVEILG